MSLESIVTNTVYDTMLADDATYVDGSGEQIAVKVVPEHDPAVLLGASEIGVRGARQAFRMRKSALSIKPSKGEHLTHEGTRYCVDGPPIDLNPSEWLLYVIA